MMTALILMAIRPCFAEAIYGGNKKFEYRRVIAKIKKGDRIWVYESSALGHVTGEFTCGDVTYGRGRDFTSLEMDDHIQTMVNEYLDNAGRVSAIEIQDPIRWSKPVELRELDYEVAPPQSYLFLHR